MQDSKASLLSEMSAKSFSLFWYIVNEICGGNGLFFQSVYSEIHKFFNQNNSGRPPLPSYLFPLTF